MTHVQYRLAVIVGSVRSGRFGPVVADWVLSHLAKRNDTTVDVIDLAELTLPATLDGSGDTVEFRRRVAEADAFVVVTPEYNHGYPGGLKTAIDTAVEEWRAKPVAFVSYGGTAGGLRSVEALRLVFTELQAVTMRRAVSFHWVHSLFDGEGVLIEPDASHSAAESMFDQLAWWTRALHEARSAYPYPE